MASPTAFLTAVLLLGTAASATPQAARPTGAELFGEGVFSTGLYELPPTFTPDRRAAYYTVSTPAYGRLHVIMERRLQENGGWSEPRVASFSGRYGDADPLISPDGSQLFFISRRPLTRGGEPRGDFDIFYVQREGEGWGEPVHVAAASGPGPEYYASVAADGTLYIAATRPDSQGRGDIYRVPLRDGEYGEPENLGPQVNSPGHHDTTPYIAPDESYLVFSSYGRADGTGPGGDLYISYNRGGDWTPAVNLGPEVNSARTDFCPTVSHDGRHLYFASDRGFGDAPLPQALDAAEWIERLTSHGNGLGDTYRIEMDRVFETTGGRPLRPRP